MSKRCDVGRTGMLTGLATCCSDRTSVPADLDHCCKRDAKIHMAKIDQWAQDLRNESNGAYCEVTPSGEGLRLIGTVAGEELHCSFKVENAHPDAKIEFYRKTARFIAITGLMLGDCAQLSPFDDFMELAVARYDRNGPDEERRHRVHQHFINLLRNGVPWPDRSEHFQGVVWHLANVGWTIDQIVQEMARYPNGIALKYADRLHQEVTRSYEKWAAPEPCPTKRLPIIRSIDGQIARMVDQAQSALIAADVPIFVRGGMLVEPITVERQAADDRKTMVTVFAPLSAEKLGYLLNKHAAVFTRYDLKQKKRVKIDPPSKVTAALVKLKSWQFPEVVGIVGAPTMRPDGSILSKVGYDPATRLWCNSDVELPTIPERPTIERGKTGAAVAQGTTVRFSLRRRRRSVRRSRRYSFSRFARRVRSAAIICHPRSRAGDW